MFEMGVLLWPIPDTQGHIQITAGFEPYKAGNHRQRHGSDSLLEGEANLRRSMKAGTKQGGGWYRKILKARKRDQECRDASRCISLLRSSGREGMKRREAIVVK